MLFAGTFALGVALLSTVKNYTKDLFGLLLGDVLAIQASDLIVIAVMGAAMLAMIFYPLHRRTLKWVKNRTTASLMTTIAVLFPDESPNSSTAGKLYEFRGIAWRCGLQ